MSAEADQVDGGRRHFLLVATSAVGAVGAVATAVPFLASWRPSARAKALGGPVEADISKLQVGELMKVEWRGQAIYVVRRSEAMIAKLASNKANLRDPDSAECWWAYVPIWAVRHWASLNRVTQQLPQTGRAVFIAPATVPNLIWRGASSRTCQHRLI